jgi:hypothetical protein
MHYTNYSVSKDAIKETVLESNYEELGRIETLVLTIIALLSLFIIVIMLLTLDWSKMSCLNRKTMVQTSG